MSGSHAFFLLTRLSCQCKLLEPTNRWNSFLKVYGHVLGIDFTIDTFSARSGVDGHLKNRQEHKRKI